MDSLTALALSLGTVAGVYLLARRRVRSHHLHLLADDDGNECLVLDGALVGDRCLFLVDTAYAGAPVLSVSYLSVLQQSGAALRRGPIASRYRRTMRLLADDASAERLHEAVNEFAGRGVCRSFTSGCTMRLMGIGETSEAHSDMFLCPPVRFAGPPAPPLRGWDADVFVTNPLPGSVHILTADYLLHHAPCLIEPARGRLLLHVPHSARHGFDLFPAVFVGGAFLVPIKVGGVVLEVVVDTGAAAPLSLSRAVGARLPACVAGGPARKTHQRGVNGEHICSDVLRFDVTIGATVVRDAEVLLNAQDVEGADGYVGIGFLRMFDLFLTPAHIGFRANGLPFRGVGATATEGQCGAGPPCRGAAPDGDA